MPHLPPIVGIGASAGGLEALRDFVQSLPNDSGLACVVVQHLSPDQPSLMDKLLGAHTNVPVVQIEDGGTIEPDHVYIIAPGRFLAIEDGRFRLIEHDREEGVRTPIDRFFRSLADVAGEKAFAIVLSGTGSDGTAGVRAIKSCGGIALAQESGSARFPGMPDSAAATGLVDFVLRPDNMPGKIMEILDHRREINDRVGRDRMFEQVEERLQEVLDRLADASGTSYSFAGYKPGTLIRRIVRRMTLLRQSSVDGYLRTLGEKPDERQLLTQDFLIGVTRFFRDPEDFDVLRQKVLEPLLNQDQSSFRVWVPGCSTGEEAFSIAILVSEMREATGDTRPWKIFGTDIDIDALRQARTGRYPEASLEGLSDSRRDQYLARDENHWQVKTQLREMCVFAPHNLLQDPPFSKLDLISCRNVMIYLNADSQATVLPRFHYGLNPSRYLWLGPSETIGRSERYFRTVDRGAKLFRRDDQTPPGFSAIAPPPVKRFGTRPVPPSQAEAPAPEPVRDDIETRAEQLFLQHRAAPFAVINRHDEVVYVSEAMTGLVRPARGATSISLDDYLAKELRLPTHSALSEVRETGLDAEVRNIVVEHGATPVLYDVSVTPFGGDSDLLLLALSEVRQGNARLDQSGQGEDREASYEQELLLTRKRLSALERDFERSEQELRSANEELLSMNEELQSSNEELETSREELQSINEELETINAELSENNRQLTRANSDLKNLLESTDIATLFIDENDCVRLYTPELSRLFGVQDRDIGRSIHDLSSKVEYPQMKDDADSVRRSLQPVEREVRVSATDETFVARMRPYRTVDNRLDGAVLTFVNVTLRKRNERQLEENARTLRAQYAELEQLYDMAPIGLNLLDRDLRFLRINAELAAINGYPVEDHIGKRQADLVPLVHTEIVDYQERVFKTAEPVRAITVRTETPAEPGAVREWVVDFYPVMDGDAVFAVGTCVREVTNERELERQIAESEARLRRIFDNAPIAISMHEGPDLVTSYSNPANQDDIGGRKIVGLPIEESMPELSGSELLRRIKQAFSTGQSSEAAELEALVPSRTGKGPRSIFRNVLEPWFDARGNVEGVISFSVDVTDQALAQQREAEHRRRLQRLQDGLSAFVGMLDPDGTLTEANAVALGRGGLSRDDVIGRKFWDCPWWTFSQEVQEGLKDAVSRAARGETVRYDVQSRMIDDEIVVLDLQLVPLMDESGRVTEILPSAIDVTERVRAEERKDILLGELEHRVKNSLATAQAVARFTARTAVSKEDMARSLTDRLAAISRTHDALTRRDWSGQSLRALVEVEVAPFIESGDGRFVYDGDDLLLEPSTALSLGLAFHELASNAAKYGAFKTDAGRVEVEVKSDAGRLALLRWTEQGGPAVDPPESKGFGTFLIETLLARELNADISLNYETNGLKCVIKRRSGPN